MGKCSWKDKCWANWQRAGQTYTSKKSTSPSTESIKFVGYLPGRPRQSFVLPSGLLILYGTPPAFIKPGVDEPSTAETCMNANIAVRFSSETNAHPGGGTDSSKCTNAWCTNLYLLLCMHFFRCMHIYTAVVICR